MKAIVLAAGLSRRMKTQKLLLPFGAKTVVAAVLDAVTNCPFSETIVVASKGAVAPHVAECGRGCRIVVNPEPETGQSGSLRLGLSALKPEDDFCVVLGDLPLLQSRQITLYARMFQNRSGAFSALAPERKNVLGHPIFFAALWRERFLAIHGDTGGKEVIRRHVAEVMFVPGEDSFFIDVDTPEEYERVMLGTIQR